MSDFPLTRGPERAEWSDGEIVFLTPVRNVDVSEVFPSHLPRERAVRTVMVIRVMTL